MPIYDETATGGAVGAGSATTSMIFSPTPSGGGVGSGTYILTHQLFPSGEMIQIGGESPVSVEYLFSEDIEWDVNQLVEITKTVSWDVGLQPLYWYRVQGCCRFPTAEGDGLTLEENNGNNELGGCEVIPFQSDDGACTGALGKVQYIQNIPARSLGHLCEQLLNDKWTWEICSIKRFSRPLLNALVDPDDTCNKLEEVAFADIPACIDFALHTTAVSRMGIFTECVDNVFQTPATGGISLSGSAECGVVWPSAEGSGGIVMGGEANVTSQAWEGEGSGGIILGGEGSYSSSYFAYTPEGGIILGSEAGIVSLDFTYEVSGGIIMGGEAPVVFRIPYLPDGLSENYPSFAGIVLSGDAYYPIHILGDGGIIMGGEAYYPLKILGDGGIVIGGESIQTSPSFHYQPGGGIILGGESGLSTPSLAYSPDGNDPIILGGECETRDSIDGDFWYEARGEIIMGGEAEYSVPTWHYIADGDGPIIMGGDAGWDSTWQGEFYTEMGITATVDSEEVVFGVVDNTPQFVAPSTVISTNCGICTDMPLLLNIHHNLEYGGFLKDFMLRNGLDIPNPLPMHYSKRLQSWQANYHLSGLTDDEEMRESWRFTFEWACVDELGGLDLGGNTWKFSMLVARKNLSTGEDFDTRVLIAFPPEEICKKALNVDFDFSFKLDTKRLYVSTGLNLVVDVILVNDNIGLFKTSYWRQFPDLRIRLSENKNVNDVERKNIKPIFPEQPLLIT